jgi:hypothetical protein
VASVRLAAVGGARYEAPMPPRTIALSLALALATPAGAAGPSTIEDDYPRALAVARERGVPILVDVWAPW